MLIKRYWFLLILLIATSYVQGQVPYFQHYNLLKNKPTVVNTLYRDKTGFMWFGTTEGLFKFNGTSYRQYTTADSLLNQPVTSIVEDSLGRVWVGYKNGQISIIDHDKIEKFNPAEGLPTKEISDMLFDKYGVLWFSTLNDGLYFFKKNRLYRLDEAEGMPDLFVYDLTEDSKGNVWAGTDRGIAICTLNDKNATIELIDSKSGLPDNIVRKLDIRDNTLWIGTDDAGVFRYDLEEKKFESIITGAWKYGYVSDFALKDNQIWISCPQFGLAVWNSKEKQLEFFGESTGPEFMSINTVLADREGNIWTGSKLGVMRTHGDYLEYIQSLSPAMDMSIVAVAKDKRNVIWFANSEGLFTLSKDGVGESRVTKQLLNTIYQKYSVISLYVDGAGYVWAGLYGEGVLRIDPNTRKVKYLNKELRNGNVLNITGKGDEVWLSTLGGGTQIKYSGENLQIKNYTRGDGLSTDYIYQIFIDSRKRVWFATDGKGVDMLDNSGFHHYEQGLASKVIYNITEDASNHIWVNAQGSGLYILYDNVFKPIMNKDNLEDTDIGSITTDARGNMVIFYNGGIEVYDIPKNKVRRLGEEVGMGERKPILNAFASDAAGNIYFGTDQGIVKYSPMETQELTIPQPLIESFSVLDKKVDLSKKLDFSYNENFIKINFLGFWFQHEADLNFRYRLDNNDRSWIYTKDHEVTFSSLAPGRYIFHLQASETDDFTNAEDATVTFVIDYPFWRTPVFYIFCVVLFISLGYTYVKYRERKIKLDKQVLEQMVKERTIEIERKNLLIQEQTEEIKAINENLEGLVKERTVELERKNKALEEYAFITAHKLRAPVASVLGLINLMTKLEHDKEAKEIITHMNDSAEKLDAIVSSITRAIEKGD